MHGQADSTREVIKAIILYTGQINEPVIYMDSIRETIKTIILYTG